nr:MAG TPA: hypothetical protein [Caudoviricetes sp.]
MRPIAGWETTRVLISAILRNWLLWQRIIFLGEKEGAQHG